MTDDKKEKVNSIRRNDSPPDNSQKRSENLKKSKKKKHSEGIKVKDIITYIIYIITVTCMVVFLLFSTKSVEAKQLEFSNNEIQVKYALKDNFTEYLIEYSDNIFFFNAEKVYSLSDTSVISDVQLDTVYLKIKPYAENFAQPVTKIHVLKNHEHNYVRDESKTIEPECKTDGAYIDICAECDSMKNTIIPMLGCSNNIAGYKETTCLEDGYTLWRCERCGEFEKVYSEKVDHGYKYTETISNSTCVVQGEAKYTCVGCSTEKIEKLALKNHSYYFSGESVNGSTIYANSKCSMCGRVASKALTMQYTGTYAGLFAIPAYGYYLPIYSGGWDIWQTLVDNPNSGCLVTMFNMPVLAEHAHQGFNIIKKAVPGSTVRYFAGEKYICVSNFNGYNTKSDIVNLDGVSINAIPAGLYTYACNDWSGRSVRIVGWNKV